MNTGLTLAELRRARKFTQEQLATGLCVKQPAIAKLEKKKDMHISSLRRFIEAMGGQLEIHTVFPDGDVIISQF